MEGSLLGNHCFFAFGIQGLTKFAEGAVATAGGAILATVEDDLQMQAIPGRLGKELFQIAFRLFDVFAFGQPQRCASR